MMTFSTKQFVSMNLKVIIDSRGDMLDKINNVEEIAAILNPETEIEQKIMSDPEFIEGALWGEPRPGHPEGQVIFHILEVLNNVDKYPTSHSREKLRIMALVHDTFKHKVDISKPRTGDNHHA